MGRITERKACVLSLLKFKDMTRAKKVLSRNPRDWTCLGAANAENVYLSSGCDKHRESPCLGKFGGAAPPEDKHIGSPGLHRRSSERFKRIGNRIYAAQGVAHLFEHRKRHPRSASFYCADPDRHREPDAFTEPHLSMKRID